MLLKPLSKYHYQKAAQEIIAETGDPAAATAEAIYERGNKTLAENIAQYDNRPRKIPHVEGKLATGRAFSLRQATQPRKKARIAKAPEMAFNAYDEKVVRNDAKRARRARRAAH